jgi:DNA-binding beta-propeller fold protein YncE
METQTISQRTRPVRTMVREFLIRLAAVGVLVCVPDFARSQIFVSNNDFANVISPSGGSVGTYALDGTTMNAALITDGFDGPRGIAVSGSNLFVANSGFGYGAAVEEYMTSGSAVNAQLVEARGEEGIAISGVNLYLAHALRVGKYTISGATINESLVQGFNDPRHIAVSDDGTRIFVADFGDVPDGIKGSVGEYDTSTGATINAALITALDNPTGIALLGNSLYVANSSTGTIGKYNFDGTPVNPAFITGLSNPLDLATFGGNLYVVNNGTNSIGEYDATTGATINAALITGLNDPQGIAIVPEPAAFILFAAGTLGLLGFRRGVRQSANIPGAA